MEKLLSRPCDSTGGTWKVWNGFAEMFADSKKYKFHKESSLCLESLEDGPSISAAIIDKQDHCKPFYLFKHFRAGAAIDPERSKYRDVVSVEFILRIRLFCCRIDLRSLCFDTACDCWFEDLVPVELALLRSSDTGVVCLAIADVVDLLRSASRKQAMSAADILLT